MAIALRAVPVIAIAQDFLSECESPNQVLFHITQYVNFVNIEEWTGDL